MKYPAKWTVVSRDNSGAWIENYKPHAEMWVMVWSGEDRFTDTPTQQAKADAANVTGNGGTVTEIGADSQTYQVRGVVDGQVRWYFGFVGKDNDYTVDWTFPETMAASLDPVVELSIREFTAK